MVPVKCAKIFYSSTICTNTLLITIEVAEVMSSEGFSKNLGVLASQRS